MVPSSGRASRVPDSGAVTLAHAIWNVRRPDGLGGDPGPAPRHDQRPGLRSGEVEDAGELDGIAAAARRPGAQPRRLRPSLGAPPAQRQRRRVAVLFPLVDVSEVAKLHRPGCLRVRTARAWLADAVVEALARHVELHETGSDGLVLHTSKGQPVDRKRFGDVWRGLRTAAVEAVDLEDDAAADRLRARLAAARFHDTRHTFASTLLSGGVSVAAAAEYLGHSPAVLLTTYAHLVPADHDRARSVVQTAFERELVCHARVTAGATEG